MLQSRYNYQQGFGVAIVESVWATSGMHMGDRLKLAIVPIQLGDCNQGFNDDDQRCTSDRSSIEKSSRSQLSWPIQRLPIVCAPAKTTRTPDSLII